MHLFSWFANLHKILKEEEEEERAWHLNVCREFNWFSHLFLEKHTMITAPHHSKKRCNW